MAQVILLGTGAALSDETREHTYLVVKGSKSAVLVDCAGSPVQRLIKAGVRLDEIDHLVLTHHHPDHIYGVSVFLLDIWIAGRKKALHIHGLEETLHATRAMMHAFGWEHWFKLRSFPVEFHQIPARYCEGAISTREFTVSTAPTKHLLPSIAVRVESRSSHKSITYSSDTEICEATTKLARDSSILFHEATTLIVPKEGHSSASQAGSVARQAGVSKLVLVHVPPHCDVKKWRAAAQRSFPNSAVGKDMARFEF